MKKYFAKLLHLLAIQLIIFYQLATLGLAFIPAVRAEEGSPTVAAESGSSGSGSGSGSESGSGSGSGGGSENNSSGGDSSGSSGSGSSNEQPADSNDSGSSGTTTQDPAPSTDNSEPAASPTPTPGPAPESSSSPSPEPIPAPSPSSSSSEDSSSADSSNNNSNDSSGTDSSGSGSSGGSQESSSGSGSSGNNSSGPDSSGSSGGSSGSGPDNSGSGSGGSGNEQEPVLEVPGGEVPVTDSNSGSGSNGTNDSSGSGSSGGGNQQSGSSGPGNGEQPAEEPPAGEAPAEEPPVGEPPVNETPSDSGETSDSGTSDGGSVVLSDPLVGLIDLNNGFPLFYRDALGNTVVACLDGSDPNCVLPGAGEEPNFDPNQPTVFTDNFPSEFFYWIAESDRLSTPLGGRVSLRTALEGAFLNEDPSPGDQMVFGRLRLTGTGLEPNSTYTVTHPYGVDTYTTNDVGVVRRPDGTEDIGCEIAPCDFSLALNSRVFDGFLKMVSGAPAGYLGDGATLGEVTGSPLNQNFFRIEGPGLPLGGLFTDMFTVAGKLFDGIIPPQPPADQLPPAPPAPEPIDIGDAAAGPIDPSNGFPLFYQDALGTAVVSCLDGSDPVCVLPGAGEEPNFDPSQPTVFTDNFPSEFFYWIAESDLVRIPETGGKFLFRMAVEGAFLGEDPAPGDQMVFGRLRATGTGLEPNSIYNVTHPYGIDTYETNDVGVIRRPVGTEDIGCEIGPCDFSKALASRVFQSFLRWDAGAPLGYLGDAITPHTVIGSPLGNNFVRIEGPGLPLEGLFTNLFTVAGKLLTELIGPNPEPPVNEPPSDQPPAEEPPTNEDPVGDEPPTNDVPPVDETPVDETPTDEQPVVNEPPANEQPAPDNNSGSSEGGSSGNGNTGSSNPESGNTGSGDNSGPGNGDQPPSNQPPAEEPPVNEPPAPSLPTPAPGPAPEATPPSSPDSGGATTTPSDSNNSTGSSSQTETGGTQTNTSTNQPSNTTGSNTSSSGNSSGGSSTSSSNTSNAGSQTTSGSETKQPNTLADNSALVLGAQISQLPVEIAAETSEANEQPQLNETKVEEQGKTGGANPLGVVVVLSTLAAAGAGGLLLKSLLMLRR